MKDSLYVNVLKLAILFSSKSKTAPRQSANPKETQVEDKSGAADKKYNFQLSMIF